MQNNGIVDNKNIPPLWEELFAVFVLFLSTDAVIPLLRSIIGRGVDPMYGDIKMQAIWFGIYTITCVILMVNIQRILPFILSNKLIWVLVILAFISTTWSNVPMVTARNSVALLGTTIIGVYLAYRYTQQEVLKLLAWALGLCVICSIGFVLLFPEFGIHQETYYHGAWRGIYIHKNLLGSLMALGAIVWLIYSLINVKRRPVGLCFCFAATAVLYLSNSITSIVVFLTILFLLLMFRVLRRYLNFGTLMAIMLVFGGAAVLLISNLDLVFAVLGRDMTLTGRLPLWQVVLEKIWQRPWLGYGYSGFWLGWQGPSSIIWEHLSWKPPHAHNGFLDVWLQLGLAGTIFFMLSLVINIFQAFTLLRKNRSFEALFPLLMLIFIVIYNMAESAILVRNSIYWILYVVISVRLNMDYRSLKQLSPVVDNPSRLKSGIRAMNPFRIIMVSRYFRRS